MNTTGQPHELVRSQAFDGRPWQCRCGRIFWSVSGPVREQFDRHLELVRR